MSNERNAKHLEYVMQGVVTESHRKALEAGVVALRESGTLAAQLKTAHDDIMRECCPGPDDWPADKEWWQVAADRIRMDAGRIANLMSILRAGKLDHWAATHGSDEGGFSPTDWVVAAEAALSEEGEEGE